MEDVTALIKTFLRDQFCVNCVSTLRQHYPGIRIMVADDGHFTSEKESRLRDLGVEKYIRLPWNSGLSVGRNVLIDACTTPFFLLGDDDFSYISQSRLQDLVSLMAIADLAGGTVVRKGEPQHYEATFVPLPDGGMQFRDIDRNKPLLHGGITYYEADITFNFFIARTEVARRVRWEESIKVCYEHEDFFLGAKDAGVRVVYCPDSIVEHRSAPFEVSRAYQRFRANPKDKDVFLKKWGFKYVEDMFGDRMYPDIRGTAISETSPPTA
jgi:GT2 family glycosyltransferase